MTSQQFASPVLASEPVPKMSKNLLNDTIKHPSSSTLEPSKESVSSTTQAAVLKPSDPVPEDARTVQGIDFNDYQDAPITVEEMVKNMSSMGFQASAVGDAVRVVDDMVGEFCANSRIAIHNLFCFSWVGKKDPILNCLLLSNSSF